MKKLFTLLLLVLFVGLNADAKKKECNLSALPATSENTTWDAATNTFAWTATWYNSTQLFAGGDFSDYKTLNYVAEAGTADHFRFIIKFTDGTAQVTYSPATVGTVSLTWAQLGVDATKLDKIAEIRLSGANDCQGDVKITSLYVEGPDTFDPITLYPAAGLNLKDLKGTNANWASTVVYPKELAVQGQAFGDGDGGNEATHVDVSGYDCINLVVSGIGAGACGLRVWFWNGTGVTTLWAYPAEQYETADFTVENKITGPGLYKVKIINGLKDLKGIKAANHWGMGPVTVEYAWVSKDSDKDQAINGYRMFSSKKPLDFTNAKDVEAYVAADIVKDQVYMKKVKGKVPAGTGLLLKSDSKEAMIKIPTCAPFDSTFTNHLVAVEEAQTINRADKGTNYLFANGQWNAVASETALPAGSSYLYAKNSSYAKLDVTNEEIIIGDPGYMNVDGYQTPGAAPEGYLPSQLPNAGNGMYQFPEETPEQEGANSGDAATGIKGAQAGVKVVSIVTANGAKADKLQKGINIVTLSNGQRVKVLK